MGGGAFCVLPLCFPGLVLLCVSFSLLLVGSWLSFFSFLVFVCVCFFLSLFFLFSVCVGGEGFSCGWRFFFDFVLDFGARRVVGAMSFVFLSFFLS